MYPYCVYAVVTDNKDPDKLNRVKVSAPYEESSVSDWIPVVTPLAGADSGFSVLPNVDDQVLVVYLDDQHVRQAVLGGIWYEEAAPPETQENADADLNKDGNNALSFIKSKSGAMIILDDTEGKEKIQLIAADGKSRLEFRAEDKMTTLSTEYDLTIGAKGSITIDAEEITITGKKQVNISADEFQVAAEKEMTLTASKDMTIKGAGVSLN
jgi:uncharacterized protein involved in type VI secretion and phage assembly